jgi:hypothetical protein
VLRLLGQGSRAKGFRCMVYGLRFAAYGLGFRVQVSVFRV